jgi:hypothetical protein
MAFTTPNSELADTVGRDWLKIFMKSFAPYIRSERATSRVTSALFIDGLAGVLALTIAGRHDCERLVVESAIVALRDAVKRDLRHLGELGHR